MRGVKGAQWGGKDTPEGERLEYMRDAEGGAERVYVCVSVSGIAWGQRGCLPTLKRVSQGRN